MYLIRALTISTTIAATLFIMGCAHKTDALAEQRMAAAACVDNPPPSDTEIRKKLEKGRFVWPALADGAVTISQAQMSYLLSGIDWRNPRESWRPTSVG